MGTNGWDAGQGAGTPDRRTQLLAAPYRRLTLQQLARAESSLHLADLARDLARLAPEDGGAGGDPRAIRLQLYHNHLPRLAHADLVDFEIESLLASLTHDGADLAASLAEQSTSRFAVSRPLR